ncbi:hypothetical protein A9K55_005576 [Cordyceps militaris]|uniref:HNH nuclease domain-containing protein n=1 Tax=Cordyceps militaris TaxID=73501 RepID=A0A2H4SAY8_CORMI|nr:hypothetical protein A9K55_005576 [Cordyceps militaris]
MATGPGQGSSSAEADLPYSRATFVDEPAIPNYQTLHEKTPAVQEIRNLYRSNKWGFTHWHLALFYLFSKEVLAELKSNPQAAWECGDAAELFGTFLTSGRIPVSYELPANPAPPAHFGKGDGLQCVVTRRAVAVDQTHIVPFSVNSTTQNIAYVPPVLIIAERLLGSSFIRMAEAMETCGGTDHIWNILPLTPYLHRLWDIYGLVGFKPCYIDAELAKSGRVAYIATFTFHWLLENGIQSLIIPEQLSADICLLMVEESESFSEIKDNIFESVYTRGRQPDGLTRLKDGHVCRVAFSRRHEAESMMRMLDLRWHASRLRCLAGGAGIDLFEPYDSDDSDSDYFVRTTEPWRIWDSSDGAA